ncbi:MAG: UxaA family hydrolase [Synergistaceae bacterium]|nr:UxaA family hydrolase [Synergistaceae bacterium]
MTNQDNVAVVVRDIAAGETVQVQQGPEIFKIVAATDVPAGHKIALSNFKSGDHVLKYGEIIGGASADILKGAHVHVHNLEGLRGRGDKG